MFAITETTPWPPIARSGSVMLSSPERTEKSGPHAAITWLIWSREPEASFTPATVFTSRTSRSSVAVAPLLRRLVVVGVDDQGARGARRLGVRRQVDRLGGRVGPGAGDHPDPSAGGLDHDLDDPLVLVVRERRRLAGRPARDEAVGPVGDVEFHELADLRLVHLAVLERGDHRDERTLEFRAHRAVSPATRSS